MKAVKILRQSRGITAIKAAADLGISQSLWIGIENGKREVPQGHIKKIEAYFGLSFDELMKDIEVEYLTQAIATAITQF